MHIHTMSRNKFKPNHKLTEKQRQHKDEITYDQTESSYKKTESKQKHGKKI